MGKFNDGHYDPPEEAEEPCKICHYPEGQCTCPECSCGEVGNPACINKHLPFDQWPHFRFQRSEAEVKMMVELERQQAEYEKRMEALRESIKDEPIFPLEDEPEF